VGAALNLCPPDPEREIKNLHRKVLAGTDFFITQPIYRVQDGPSLLERYEAKYGNLSRPVLAGILPLVSVRHATFLHNEVPGIFIPDEMRERIEEAGEDSARVGVEMAVELVQQIKGWAQGIYLMPQFHKFDMAAEIIERVK
jgi:homocysteine S-methyltransferase